MNAPIQLVETAILRNIDPGNAAMRQIRLAFDVEGVGKAGDVIFAGIQQADTADNLAVIDNYISGYKPFQFCADIVSPIVLVNKEQGKRLERALASAFTVLDTAVGRQGHIKEIKDASARVDYATLEYALAAFIPWAAENDALEQYDIRTATSEMIADLLLLAREVRIWDFVTTLTNWNTLNRTSLTTNFKWDNGSTKDPRKDIHDRVSATAQPITGMAMNPDVAFWFLSDNNVRAYLKAAMGDAAPNPELALGAESQGYVRIQLVGMPELHICPAKKLNASGALVYVLGDDVVLFSRPAGAPNMNSVATSLTFRHRGKSGTGWVTNEYLPNGRGINGGRMLETGFGEVTFMGSDRAGGLIKDVLST